MFIVHRYIDGLEAADAVGYRSAVIPDARKAIAAREKIRLWSVIKRI
jgi:hypothetical protein